MERGVASEASDLGGLGIAPREFEVDHMDSAPHLKKKETWYIFSFVFKFIFSPPSLYFLRIYASWAWIHKLANHVKELWPWHCKTDEDIFGVIFVCFELSFAQVCYPLFGILKSFWVFVLAKCWYSFNKFNTYFLRSLNFSLFFFVNGFFTNIKSDNREIIILLPFRWNCVCYNEGFLLQEHRHWQSFNWYRCRYHCHGADYVIVIVVVNFF